MRQGESANHMNCRECEKLEKEHNETRISWFDEKEPVAYLFTRHN